jgi:hypothetical protein
MFKDPRTGRTQRFLYRLAFCFLRYVALPPTPGHPPPPSLASSGQARRGEPAPAGPARGSCSSPRWRS